MSLSIDVVTNLADLVAAFGGGGSGSGGGGGGGGGFSGGGSDFGGSSSDGEPLGWRGTLVLAAILVGWLLWQRYRTGSWLPSSSGDGGSSGSLGLDAADELEPELWATLAASAPGWTEETTEAYVREAVVALNDAWSRLDADAMQPWLTPRMHDKMSAMVETLRLLGRRNEVSQIDVRTLVLRSVPQDPATTGAGFAIHVRARAHERLVDEHAGTQLMEATVTLDERWCFVSDGTRWLLDDIEQSSASAAHGDPSIRAFADAHGLHYSADMGRMFLPDDGVLFDGASLERSDVNNHVIGWLDRHLVQLFSYERTPDGDASDDIVVAQGVLRRAVGDILVRPRRRGGTTPKGLRRLSFESMKFEERWEVFASETDELAAFELMHPAFLERLAQLPFRVGLEAVGRCLYLFDEDGGASHEQLFDLLRRAYVELDR